MFYEVEETEANYSKLTLWLNPFDLNAVINYCNDIKNKDIILYNIIDSQHVEGMTLPIFNVAIYVDNGSKEEVLKLLNLSGEQQNDND